jgi:hypothetical protein
VHPLFHPPASAASASSANPFNLDFEKCPDIRDEYLEIGGFLDGGLRQQTEFNLDNLQRSTGRTLSESERAEFLTRQHQALRWTFLGSGMTHPNFQATLERLAPPLRQRIEEVAPVFC